MKKLFLLFVSFLSISAVNCNAKPAKSKKNQAPTLWVKTDKGLQKVQFDAPYNGVYLYCAAVTPPKGAWIGTIQNPNFVPNKLNMPGGPNSTCSVVITSNKT